MAEFFAGIVFFVLFFSKTCKFVMQIFINFHSIYNRQAVTLKSCCIARYRNELRWLFQFIAVDDKRKTLLCKLGGRIACV